MLVRSSARAATSLSFLTTRMVKLIFSLPQVTLLRLTASVGTPVASARFSFKISWAVSLFMKSEQFSTNVISKFICHAPPGVSGGGDGGGSDGSGGDGGGGDGGGGVGYPPSIGTTRLYVEIGDSLMLVPGKQALLLCMSVITKWKPVLTLMKKSEVEAFHEVSVFAKAGGARFQYTLLKFSCPRRSAFSTTPLSVVTTWTYLRALRGGGAGLRFRGARGAAAEEAVGGGEYPCAVQSYCAHGWSAGMSLPPISKQLL